MLFFYVRHGDPIYDPDSLTPLGERQAEAVGKRLAVHGLDEIYASTSERAKLTAKPACEILKKEMQLLDYANEAHAWREMTMKKDDGKLTWICAHKQARQILSDPEVLALGHEWYTHPAFAEYDYKAGLDRVHAESTQFFHSLGYERIEGTGKFKVLEDNNKRVALFAHHGFGTLFLSDLLHVPYSTYCMHFDMTHTGVTVIEFKNEDGICIPCIKTLSGISHLYHEGLPTKYGNDLYI